MNAQKVGGERVPGDNGWHFGVDEVLGVPGNDGVEVEVVEVEFFHDLEHVFLRRVLRELFHCC